MSLGAFPEAAPRPAVVDAASTLNPFLYGPTIAAKLSIYAAPLSPGRLPNKKGHEIHSIPALQLIAGPPPTDSMVSGPPQTTLHRMSLQILALSEPIAGGVEMDLLQIGCSVLSPPLTPSFPHRRSRCRTSDTRDSASVDASFMIRFQDLPGRPLRYGDSSESQDAEILLSIEAIYLSRRSSRLRTGLLPAV